MPKLIGMHYLTPPFRDKRVRLGLFIDDVAAPIGCRPKTLRNAETGNSPMKLERIYLLAQVLGIPEKRVARLVSDTPANQRTAA